MFHNKKRDRNSIHLEITNISYTTHSMLENEWIAFNINFKTFILQNLKFKLTFSVLDKTDSVFFFKLTAFYKTGHLFFGMRTVFIFWNWLQMVENSDEIHIRLTAMHRIVKNVISNETGNIFDSNGLESSVNQQIFSRYSAGLWHILRKWYLLNIPSRN